MAFWIYVHTLSLKCAVVTVCVSGNNISKAISLLSTPHFEYSSNVITFSLVLARDSEIWLSAAFKLDRTHGLNCHVIDIFAQKLNKTVWYRHTAPLRFHNEGQ